MIRTLERKPTLEDSRDAANDGEAEDQIKLEFQIPAVSRWVEHNGERLYHTLDELKDWDKKKFSFPVMHFDEPLERWAYWQKRYVTPPDCPAYPRTKVAMFVSGCAFPSFAYV
jgi:hypothetical protein